MNTTNPSVALALHFATMPASNSTLTSTTLVSPRFGASNMDGQTILSSLAKSYARPWPGCILIDELTRDNIPPFYVRLQDAQVGHLVNWVSTSRSSITRLKLGQYWPWDFDTQGRISPRRDNWGAEYDGSLKEKGKGLGGGERVPTWTDAGLPLTYTSSHKIMAGEIAALKAGAGLKRKAEEEAGRNACMPIKKPRLSNMSVELKSMKDIVAQKRQKDKDSEKDHERYAGAKPELRDAVAVVDTLMRSATETEDRNATLEAMLLANEAKYGKDTDEMFDEWFAYKEVKRVEVERIHEDYVVEIKDRDSKIDALNKEAMRFRARLDKEKKKARVRDERLALVKRYWAQEQEVTKKRLREIEEGAVDLDELSEFNYGSCNESDDEEADFDVESEETRGEAKAKAEAESKEAKEAKEEANCTVEPKEEAKEPTGRELGKSIARERVESVGEINLVNLVEDDDEEDDDEKGEEEEDDDEEDEDEGPISSQRKLRDAVRSKPAQGV